MKTVIIKNSIVEELTNGKEVYRLKNEYEKNREILIQKLYKVIHFMPSKDLQFVYNRGDYNLNIRSYEERTTIDKTQSKIYIDIKFNKENIDYFAIYNDANKLILKEIAEVDKLISYTDKDNSEIPTFEKVSIPINIDCIKSDRVSEFTDDFINEMLKDIAKISVENEMYRAYNELITDLRKHFQS